MFADAMAEGDRIGMVVTFEPAARTMEDAFRADAERTSSRARVETVLVPGAMEALRAA